MNYLHTNPKTGEQLFITNEQVTTDLPSVSFEIPRYSEKPFILTYEKGADNKVQARHVEKSDQMTTKQWTDTITAEVKKHEDKVKEDTKNVPSEVPNV